MAESKLKDSWLRFIWYLFCRFIAVGTVSLLYRLRVYGKENVPKDGPVLVVCNHQSFLDPMLSQTWIWRPFYFVPRDTLLNVKFWGRLIASLYVIFIRQGQADIAAMKTIIESLKEGKAVCLYPEGTRTHDGRIDNIKPGFGLMSRRSGAPVLPVVIDGMFEAWPRTRKYPKLGRVGVMYGTPFSAEQIKTLGDEAFAQELTRTLRTMQNELRLKMGRTTFDYPPALKESQE
jgi:1-acyl-sn-glycerol-3-phosphate acyltransferase